jgi:hypothetical protein
MSEAATEPRGAPLLMARLPDGEKPSAPRAALAIAKSKAYYY